MKKEKNGFVFMETVIVVGILSITLLLLYTSYEYILRKCKERNNFNTTESVYKVYYVKQIIDSLIGEGYVDPSAGSEGNIKYFVSHNSECSQVIPGSKSYVCDISAADYMGNLKQVALAYNVEKVYYIDFGELNTKSSAWLSSFDATTIDYLKSLGTRNQNLLMIKVNKYFNKSDSKSEILHASIDL